MCGYVNARVHKEFRHLKWFQGAFRYMSAKHCMYELEVVHTCLEVWCAQPSQLHTLTEEMLPGRLTVLFVRSACSLNSLIDPHLHCDRW